jgi:hypothetical protein
MPLSIATLDGADLPPQFSYKPYIPTKRVSVTPTANSVVTQLAAPNQIVHGGEYLSWEIDACFPSEFQALHSQYSTSTGVVYEFVGYWGETLQVLFAKLDPPVVKGRLFKVSGTFQVLEVTTAISAQCEAP